MKRITTFFATMLIAAGLGAETPANGLTFWEKTAKWRLRQEHKWEYV